MQIKIKKSEQKTRCPNRVVQQVHYKAAIVSFVNSSNTRCVTGLSYLRLLRHFCWWTGCATPARMELKRLWNHFSFCSVQCPMSKPHSFQMDAFGHHDVSLELASDASTHCVSHVAKIEENILTLVHMVHAAEDVQLLLGQNIIDVLYPVVVPE